MKEGNNMYVKIELDINDLIEQCWSGAEKLASKIYDLGLEEELFELMNEIFHGVTPSITEVNDFLRFEDAYIASCLGVDVEELSY